MENCSIRLIESENRVSKEGYIYKGNVKKGKILKLQ
jgi:hypothetical protein